jgi:molybdopterin-dependent oxidoreductase alpha subunit
MSSGGGWPAIKYALRTARRAGGVWKFLRALQTKNACKTCALGMGGQAGGMVDESGHFPEVCKKSMQAMAADMQGRIAGEFFAKYGFAELRQFTPRELEHVGRLVEPVYAGPGDSHYRVISWDEAMSRCGTWLVGRGTAAPSARLVGCGPAAPNVTYAGSGQQGDGSAEIRNGASWDAPYSDRHFFYASGRSSNEAGFLLHLFARLYGTNNVNNCSYYCHQASGVGLGSVIGSGVGTVDLEDLERCDLVFLIGANPASNHPRLMRALVKLRRRGGDVIVVNPLRETGLVNFSVPSDWRSLLFGSPIASLYVQPHIGGDIALLTGIAKRVDELGAASEGFLAQCTEGAAEFRKDVRKVSWDGIVAASGVDRATIDRAAAIYAESENAIFAWTMGITHHLHGADNVRAIANLALLRGMVGKPGAGLLPIRGHSNVQGIGSVGVTPKLRQAIFDRLESELGVKLPTTPGMDTMSCMEAMHEGRLRRAWCLGGNLFGSNPDAHWTRDAIGKLDSMVYLSTTLNTGHAWGRAKETLILPVLARDEEPQATTQESMFSYVRLSDGGSTRHAGPRSEVEIIADFAERVLGGDGAIDWHSLREHRNIRAMIAKVVPGYEAIGRIDESKQEFQISGRTMHAPRFHTPSGKARMQRVAIPRFHCGETELRLMTIRSEGQFNTVVYEDEDIYRGTDRRDVVFVSATDMARLELTENQQVTVTSSVGWMKHILVREAPIRPGNAAMYYPEANVLVPAVADRESRTPGFKSVVVTIAAETPAGMVQVGIEEVHRERFAVVGGYVRQPLNAC